MISSIKGVARKSEGKTKMKKILALVLAAILLCSAAFSLTACGGETTEPLDKAYENYLAKIKAPTDSSLPTLTIATSPDFAPMEFVDLAKKGDAQYVGFDILLANYLAKELNMKLVIKPMSFDACMAAVQSGSVDIALAGFSWTAERAETFLISDYYVAGENETEQVLLIRAADAEKYTKAEDFDGVEVGAQNASLQMQLVSEQLPNAKPYTIGEIGVGVLELQSGNIEALAVADGNGTQIIANNPDLVKCTWQFDVKAEYEANVIMMHKGDTALLAVVNEALAKAYEGGMYGPWYDEALEIAASASAIEVSIEEEAPEEAAADTAEAAEAPAEEAPAEEAPAEEATAEEAAAA